MKTLIACCGIDCATCDARTATLNNDNALREQTAAKWKEMYNSADITAETINCTGCRADGVKFAHCFECEIRKCVKSRGYNTCGECALLDSCEIVGALLKYVPEGRANLLALNDMSA